MCMYIHIYTEMSRRPRVGAPDLEAGALGGRRRRTKGGNVPPTTSYCSLVTTQAVTRGLLTKLVIPTFFLAGKSGSGSFVVVVLRPPRKTIFICFSKGIHVFSERSIHSFVIRRICFSKPPPANRSARRDPHPEENTPNLRT